MREDFKKFEVAFPARSLASRHRWGVARKREVVQQVGVDYDGESGALFVDSLELEMGGIAEFGLSVLAAGNGEAIGKLKVRGYRLFQGAPGAAEKVVGAGDDLEGGLRVPAAAGGLKGQDGGEVVAVAGDDE
jgi:hypothetical protein